MIIEQIIFYACSVLLIASALMVISSKNSVRAVLFLILSFFYAACLWMLMEAEFLAILLILVYVGAVMVLFLFVVMMLDVDFDQLKEGFTRYLPIGVLVSAILIYLLTEVFGLSAFGPEAYPIPTPHDADYSSVQTLGMLLYTHYFYPFEIAALILMVAMIAAISLAFRGKREGTRTQDISHQVHVQKSDRLRVVKMESESTNQQEDSEQGANE